MQVVCALWVCGERVFQNRLYFIQMTDIVVWIHPEVSYGYQYILMHIRGVFLCNLFKNHRLARKGIGTYMVIMKASFCIIVPGYGLRTIDLHYCTRYAPFQYTIWTICMHITIKQMHRVLSREDYTSNTVSLIGVHIWYIYTPWFVAFLRYVRDT